MKTVMELHNEEQAEAIEAEIAKDLEVIRKSEFMDALVVLGFVALIVALFAWIMGRFFL